MQKFNITGMGCAACSSRIEKAVSKVAGVKSCTVSLLTNSMSVKGTASNATIIKAVEDAGYGASPQNDNDDNDADGQRQIKILIWRLIASVVFLAVLMYFAMWSPLSSQIISGIIQMVLALAIMVVNGKFFVNGFKGVFKGSLNMDTLVGLGSGVAFIYSVYVLIVMACGVQNAGQFYFESAAMILTLITVGKTLEMYSKGKTTSALKGLMKLAPQTAVLLRDGEEIEVPIAEVKVGDIFVVRPGANIPVDGEVIQGTSSVNEAMLTGESNPADKTIGKRVSAGTMNLTGYLQCRAVRIGEDTMLSQIIRMVTDASLTKAPVARIADKVSAVFVPIVLGLALITMVVWLCVGQTFAYALARAISVLVISCPCALGLATPVAIMVGNGVGAKNGILYKTSAVLEYAGRTQIVVLDKTGTITKGVPAVTDVIPNRDISDAELMKYAYALESKSEHPLSKAIVDYAKEHKVPLVDKVDKFQIVAGSGLSATYAQKLIVGGNLNFVQTKVKVPSWLKDTADKLATEGKTPLYFTYGDKLLGIIAVADAVRQESIEAINELKNMGLKVLMLTGDNLRTAQAIGKQVGVDEVIAEVLPNEKEKVIKALKKFGRVMMVGDGINDAPALTSADVGVAIGAGTDIAIDAAEIVLVNSRLTDVPAMIKLSKATLRNIKQNLFWAFIYNLIGIPLAAGVYVPLFGWEMNPMYGAAAMSLSSICVVLNALRLNLFNLRKVQKHTKKRQTKIDLSAIVYKND